MKMWISYNMVVQFNSCLYQTHGFIYKNSHCPVIINPTYVYLFVPVCTGVFRILHADDHVAVTYTCFDSTPGADCPADFLLIEVLSTSKQINNATLRSLRTYISDGCVDPSSMVKVEPGEPLLKVYRFSEYFKESRYNSVMERSNFCEAGLRLNPIIRVFSHSCEVL